MLKILSAISMAKTEALDLVIHANESTVTIVPKNDYPH